MSVLRKMSHKFDYEELSGICFQISLMLHSGISLFEGLDVMCEVRDQDSATSEVLRSIADEMRLSSRLSEALEKTAAFPDSMIGMVQLGENTGKLEDVMSALAEHYKREGRLRGMIFRAIFYPSVLFVMISAVIVALMVRVLPEFTRVLDDMGIESSSYIRMLINFGNNALRYILIIVAILLFAVFAFLIYSKLSGKRHMLSDMFFRIPFLRRISDKVAAGQFASAMALAVSGGYGITDAFMLMDRIIVNRRTLGKISFIGDSISKGSTFSQAVILSGIFDGMPERMVAVGEKSGRVDAVMREISAIYEEETSVSLNNLVSTIEPAMVAFLALVSGTIMLVIMLPLIGIISSIG